ncbi:MAG: carbohydrate binding domain-containing protein, partial [Candidatus Daviesbacteria bacterium]|nr:carbohydrate binding domain-containing protein [Candidatus Daviesbacteria bacterium]
KYFTALNLFLLGFFISLLISPAPVIAAASLSGTTATTDIFLGGNSSIIGARWENIVPEAEPNDTIFFKVAVYNDGDTPADNTKVKVDFSTTPGNQTANIHLTAGGVTEVTDTVTVPVSGNLNLSHTPGRAVIIANSGITRLTSANDNLTTEGINIGTSLPGRENRIDVIFTARLIEVLTSTVTPSPTDTETELPTTTPANTPIPTPTPIAYGYAVAESQLSLDSITTAQTGTIAAPLTFPVTIPHTFTNSEPGIKTLFVKFFYANGTTQTSQQSLIYSPPPTVTPTPTTTTPLNLLQNPGFEESLTDNWRCINRSSFDTDLGCQQAAGRSGNYAGGTNAAWMIQEINLTPGSLYCFSGYIRLETSQAQNINFGVVYRDSSGAIIYIPGTISSISDASFNNNWVGFRIGLPIPQEFTQVPKALSLENNRQASFYIDDTSLTEGACQ